MAEVLITEFTDPGCPFAFSAEPFRRKLEWLYGDRIEWRPRMVVLAEAPDEYLAKGFEPPKPARSSKRLAGDYGMPMDTRERPRMAALAQASRRTSSAATTPPTCRGAALGGDAAGLQGGRGRLRTSVPEAREALGRVAVEQHVGADGFWSLTG